jgi:hypothetical protein
MVCRLVVYSLSAGASISMSIGRAAEQDYAARFEQLGEKKADAQIEPLLNEWCEKRPNDQTRGSPARIIISISAR